MSLNKLLAIFLLVIGALPIACFAELEVHPHNNSLALGLHSQYLIDPNNTLNIEELISNPTKLTWQPSQQEILNFGFTQDTYWFQTAFQNGSTEAYERFLLISYSLLNNIELYLYENNLLITKTKMGDHLPFHNRPVNHRQFIVPVKLKPNHHYKVYLRVETDSAMQIPLYLISERSLFESDQAAMISQGLYFGIAFAMIIFNLFLYYSMRDPNYLLYVLSVFCTALVQATLRGYSYQYLWPDSPLFQHYHMPVIVSLAGAFVALFSLYFLDLKSHHRLLHRLVQLQAFILIANAALSPLIGYSISARIGVGVTTLFAVTGFIAGILIWRKGFKPASYFTLAYLALFMGTFLIALSKFGLIPRNFITENAQEFGSALEMLLLSFALAYRITLLRQEKEQAQLDATHRLEQKVEERTVELRQTMDRLAQANSQLARQNREDGLTRTLNRRYFDESVEKEWQSALRGKTSLALIMCDVDHFKSLNDEHGHLAGDDCLRLIATCIKSAVERKTDSVYRYGGEEFAILLPNVDEEGAMHVAEKIRITIAEQIFHIEEARMPLTVSAGVAVVIPKLSDSHLDLVEFADKALYHAKTEGRNRVELYKAPLLSIHKRDD